MALTQIIGDGLKSTLAIGSEGGAVTTSVQQGLAKAWLSGSNAAVVSDSINIASGTDNGTGDYTYAFTSNMSNALWSASGVCDETRTNSLDGNADRLSSDVDVAIINDTGNRANQPHSRTVHGDLA
jgi:hypothetical protein